MRRSSITLTLALLCGCGPSQQQRLETAALSDAATDCIRREAASIASKPVDLDTAATAVLARCNAELWAEEKAFVNRYAGYRDIASEQFKRVRAARLEQAYKAVALARTN
jgi:hypothetical protein